MHVPSALIRITLLIAALHVYLALTSLIFQKLESQGKNQNDNKNLIDVIKLIKTGLVKKNNFILAKDVRKAVNEDDKNSIGFGFKGMDEAYLFTLMSFTTLGNSGFRPLAWQSQLFYIFALPFGFALYVIIIISLAYHIRDAMQTYVTSLEKKPNADIAFLNSKILAISFMTCICVLQIGAVASIFKRHSYLYGLYLSIDLMIFIGNEDILEKGQAMKLYFSFLFSFYLIVLHSVLLVFISSCCHAWKEISDICTQRRSINCFRSDIEPLSSDYKEKLLASFDSSSSGTNPNEVAVGDDAYFPQFDENEIGQAHNLDIIDSDVLEAPERRDSRFSEIFNAQKNNFEPIDEGIERFDADIVDASSEKSIEECMHHKVNEDLGPEDIGIEESKKYKPKEEAVYFFNESSGSDLNTEVKKENFEESVEKILIESGANSPMGSTPSLPSSYSNISLDSWDDGDEEETLSGTRLSRDLETSLLGDSNNTITQK